MDKKIEELRELGIEVDVKTKTIYFDINNPVEIAIMRDEVVAELCKIYGFARQSILK